MKGQKMETSQGGVGGNTSYSNEERNMQISLSDKKIIYSSPLPNTETLLM
jgi:hypothetical protein